MINSTTFAELSLLPEMMTAIEELGFTETTAVQAQSIPVIRSGVDIFAQSQTGTGKTMAFAIPAVERIVAEEHHVQVLILSPTRELAQQCGEEIRKLAKHMPHIKTADVYGGSDYGTQFRALRNANIVIGTPGRVMDHMTRESLNLNHLKMIILDEADEMLNMGFKEDIETILKDAPTDRQIVLFSATAPYGIMSITKQFQKDPVQVNVNQSQAMLNNITQLSCEVPMRQKTDALKLLMHYFKPHRAIVFANTKSMVDELVEILGTSGFYTQGLHGDMKQMQRTSVMNGFKSGKINILVATDVAARGIDVSDIDYVFNFDIPKMSEYYVHRIGRTGRAGRDGTAVTLCCGRQQAAQLSQLARRIKSVIKPIPLPTLADIQRSNATRDMELVVAAMANEVTPAYQEMLESLVAQGHAPEAIATAMMGLHFHHSLRGLTDLKQPVRTAAPTYERTNTRSTDNGSSASRPVVYKKPLFTDLVINIGSSNRVVPNHIIGAIADYAGVRSKRIGQIDIGIDNTVVGVPSEQADDIIFAMQEAKICGRDVTVTTLVEPRRRRVSDGPRSNEGKKPYNKPAGNRPYKPFRKDAHKEGRPTEHKTSFH